MTIFIVLLTTIVSIAAFSRRELFGKLLFSPYQVYHRREWYRLITHGLLHADWVHLAVNMFVLFSFGGSVEYYFSAMTDMTWLKYPSVWYLVFYIMALVVSSLTTLKKHRDDVWYSSVGASGAVSAVLFFSIFFEPHNTLLFMGIVPIKAYIFGPLYLVYSWYASRKNADNINHDAHLLGALWGFTFPLLIDPRLITWFIGKFL